MKAEHPVRADLILHNGQVITVDRSDSIQQAIAVSAQDYPGSGQRRRPNGSAGPGTTTIDLRGRTVIPGIVDIHAHLDREGLKSIFPSLAGLRSVADILERIGQLAAEKVPGEWW